MQIETSAGRAATARPAVSLYLMSWVAVAAFGLGYIGVAATRPDLLGAILPLAEPVGDQAGIGRSSSDLADEIASLRKWVHELQHELAATRSTLQEQVAHSSAIVQRLAAAEERLGALREVRDAKEPLVRTPAPRVPGRAQAPVPEAVRVGQAGAADSPSVASSVNVINGPAAQIATGSVPDAAARAAAGPATPAFGPAKVAAAPTSPRGIEIGTADSLDGLRAKWGELTGRNAAALGGLSPRYRLSADGRSAPFTLLAGPFESSAEATKVCNSMRASGVACRVGAYSGNAF